VSQRPHTIPGSNWRSNMAPRVSIPPIWLMKSPKGVPYPALWNVR